MEGNQPVGHSGVFDGSFIIGCCLLAALGAFYFGIPSGLRAEKLPVFGLYLSPEIAFRTRCRDDMRCGIERARDARMKCSAYPINGRIVWSFGGTFADAKDRRVLAKKFGDCGKGGFYDRVPVGRDRQEAQRGIGNDPDGPI